MSMRWLMGTTAQRKVSGFVAFILTLSVLLIDSFWLFESGFSRAAVAEAATGDFAVFREATGTETVAGTSYPVTWDTTVSSHSNLALQGNSSDILLSEGGKYLVLYNVWTEEGAEGGANRRSLASYLTLNDIPLEYGWGAGYIRDAEDDFTAYNTGAAIIEAGADDELAVLLDRDDDNAGAGTAIRAGTNGVSVLKLEDSLEYARVHSSAGTTDIGGDNVFTAVTWDTADEIDTGTFSFSAPSTGIAVDGSASQKLLVTANVKLEVTDTAGPRQNYEMRLTLDGAEVPGTRTTVYLRNDNGTVHGTLQYTGIIQKTAAGSETLQLEVRSEGTATTTTNIVGDATALAIVALADDAEVLSLTTDTDQALTTSPSTFSFGSQIATSTTYFSHSTSLNPDEVELVASGDYLAFATTYTSRTSGTGRDVPRVDWQIDSVTQSYGGHGSFNRGAQGGEDTFTSGGSGGAIFPGLTSGQVISLSHQDETTGTPNSEFLSERVAVQLVELSELLQSASTDVLQRGAPVATAGIPATNQFSGEQFAVIESVATRNITNIVFTESGTIDAATNLANVSLFYDLDTSNPYDCVSESYGGGESQFGSDGTVSGADGIITFTDSVSVSPTSALCGYVVYDILSGAQNGDTIDFLINSPATDVVVTGGGTVAPVSAVGAGDSTTLVDAEITQTGYHWRNDDGNETGATSATGGSENEPGLTFAAATTQRLRVGVANTGSSSATMNFRLEYAEKVSTCADATGWTDVGAVGGAWDMSDSTFLIEGANTTNISVATGGVSDGGDTFISNNAGVKDVLSETGAITLADERDQVIAAFAQTSVLNGIPTTITLDDTFVDPIVVASARYPRTGTQRTTRISNKTSNSFDVLVDNFDGSLGVGTTDVDYLVFEAGEWDLEDGGSGTKIFATTTTTSVSAGRTLPDNPGGAVVTYPTSFSNPTVLASIVTSNDADWAFASVYDGTNVDNPPGTASLTTFLNDNFDSDGHLSAEAIDIIVFEENNGSNNGVAFDFTSTAGAVVSNTPVAVNYGASYSSAPSVILVQAMTQLGSDGGYAQVDTNSAPTASQVTLSTDEDGATADRGHAAEEVALVTFAQSGTSTRRIVASEFVELEYSIEATGAAVEGVGYCFRVSDAGTPLRNYTEYAEATLNADVTVSAQGTQNATLAAGATDAEIGGSFVVQSNSGARTVTDITVTETGSIDAATYLANPRIAVEFDTSLPYDCASESYGGGETTLTGSAFLTDNGSTTVSGSGSISPTQSLCAYVLVDVASTTPDGETIEFEISLPNNDVVVTSSSVGPGSAVELPGTTVVEAPSLEQAGYHWRNDDDTEADASSASGGSENTPIGPIFQNTIQRLRVAISNEGNATATGRQFRLEYGTKVTTCENIGSWNRIDDGVAFDMASTSQLVDGADTSVVLVANGGITDPNTTFLTSNGGQLEDTDQAAEVSLTTTEFIELEYAVVLTEASGFGATYCFRVTDAGTPLDTYTEYAELTVQERQDFVVQRGTETVSGTGVTLTAGVDYAAPTATSSAFVRITNTSMTGAGSDTLGATRVPDDLTAYITGPVDLTTSFTIERPAAAADNTRVSWEIVEYVGVEGGDNEFVVHAADIVTYGGTSLTATGSAVTITDDRDIVVFITGQLNPATANADANTGLSISSWASTTNQPVFERGDADGIAAGVSYAVVEFTGASWNIQRVEHTFTTAGVTEIEVISAVASPLRAFVHAQKLSGDELFNLDETGHEVWLSSIGAVSFQLENGSTNPTDQTSVAWVIENTQTGDGAMAVYRQNDQIDQTTGQPNTYLYSIGATVVPENTSIFASTRSSGAGSAHPRAYLGARVLNDTQFELWKSDEGQNQNFRVAVVEWPVAETSVRQTHYRFYEDNDALTPTDPWPPGVSDLGENTAMTDLDEPLGEGERVRIRTGLFINNATLVADSMSFKLQYARRITTCSAVSTWDDLGDPGSGVIWRGYDGTPVAGTAVENPTLLLSPSTVAGTYEEGNPSAVNPNSIDIGEYVEYDWLVENNGAIQKSSYCFRMVENDGAVLDGYDVYPTVRTSGYTPVVVNWRWYDDETNLTPTSPLAAEVTAPVDIAASNTIKLRVALKEIEGAPGEDIKFNLQYSQWADFRDGGIAVAASTSCSGGSRQWCYADGAGVNNAIIDTTVLTGVDSCTSGSGAGCGTVNEASGVSGVYDQPVLSTAEHEFTLVHDSVGFDQVYYFRLYDATNGVPVLASSSYPSLSTIGAALTFSVSGIDAEQSYEGITTDATTTATDIALGSLAFNTDVTSAQRLTVFTNGTEGYRVYLSADGQMSDEYGNELEPVGGSNASPQPWATGCSGSAVSCFGYHVGDNILYDGSVRFALDDTYAPLSTTPVEVMASGVPVTFDTSEIIYRTRVGELQPAGDYSTTLRYIVVPVF